MTVNDLIAYTLTLQDLLVCNDASTSEETSVEVGSRQVQFLPAVLVRTQP